LQGINTNILNNLPGENDGKYHLRFDQDSNNDNSNYDIDNNSMKLPKINS
jgi:hypothetical protein